VPIAEAARGGRAKRRAVGRGPGARVDDDEVVAEAFVFTKFDVHEQIFSQDVNGKPTKD
jgi:hypothetical protein